MINENMSKFDKFEDWITNKFWFHYKWYFLFGVFVLTLLIFWVSSLVTNIKYDWNVVYAHTGESDNETAEKVKSFLSKTAVDVSGNGKIDIEIYEISHTEQADQKGENVLYGALYSPDYVLMLVDKEHYELYSKLGFFEPLDASNPEAKGVYIQSLDLYAVVNNGPPLQYTLAQAEENNVTEEELKEINTQMLEEHNALVDKALSILRDIEKG